MKSQFVNDPIIQWSKEKCLYCSQPTGPHSCCEQVKERPIIMPPGAFSESCPFKATSGWIAETNYPVSSRLLERLQSIPGIDAIMAISPYRFKVAIANLHNPAQVKKEITVAYKALIKSVQVLVESPDCTAINITIAGESFTLPVAEGMAIDMLSLCESMSKSLPGVFTYAPDKSSE